jgi:hypothetical protein
MFSLDEPSVYAMAPDHLSSRSLALGTSSGGTCCRRRMTSNGLSGGARAKGPASETVAGTARRTGAVMVGVQVSLGRAWRPISSRARRMRSVPLRRAAYLSSPAGLVTASRWMASWACWM